MSAQKMGAVMIAGVIAVLLFCLRQWMLPKPIPGIPHRRRGAQSILGDGADMLQDLKGTEDTWMEWVMRQLQTLDSPIIQIFLPLKKPVVIVGDYEEARDIMMRRCPREFDRSMLLGDLLAGALPDAHIIFRTNDTFREHRRILQDLMSPGFLRHAAAPNIHVQACQLLRLWELKAQHAHGRPFDAGRDIFHAALDAVFGFAFGPHWPHSATKPKIDALLTSAASGSISSISSSSPSDDIDVPITFPEPVQDHVIHATLGLTEAVEKVQGTLSMTLTWALLSLTPTLRRARRVRDQYIMSAIQDAVSRMLRQDQSATKAQHPDDKHAVSSAVDHMVQRERQLAERLDRKPDYFSSAMRGELFGFVVGGHDTTSTTVAWGVKFLADHPESQERLRHALHEACPAAKEGCRIPSAEEILDMNAPYLDAVIEETLRCGGTSPGLDREAMLDTHILGHAIPKGTTVLLLTQGPSIRSPPFDIDQGLRSATHASRANTTKTPARSWAAHHPSQFYPERWLLSPPAGSGNMSEKPVFDPTAGPTLAFGLGLRGCWGRRLAYVELRLYLALIVWNFRLLSCPADISSYAMTAGITSKPNQCFVRLTKAS